MFLLFQGCIFRFHVSFPECTWVDDPFWQAYVFQMGWFSHQLEIEDGNFFPLYPHHSVCSKVKRVTFCTVFSWVFRLQIWDVISKAMQESNGDQWGIFHRIPSIQQKIVQQVAQHLLILGFLSKNASSPRKRIFNAFVQRQMNFWIPLPVARSPWLRNA